MQVKCYGDCLPNEIISAHELYKQDEMRMWVEAHNFGKIDLLDELYFDLKKNFFWKLKNEDLVISTGEVHDETHIDY